MSEIPLSDSIASHVTIIDEKGTPILVSGLQIKPGTTAKDRDYFKFQKNSQGDELFISKSHLGRNSGKLIVRLVRRYNRPNGEFGGVMFIALEEKHIIEIFNTMNIGPNSSATLVGEDQNIRARSSYGKIGHGQNISGSRIWKELEQSPVGLYRQVSVVDNITRYYAYRRVPEFPLIVAIGMSVDDLGQGETKSELYDYSLALLATLLIVITAVFLCRQQHLMATIEAKNIELARRNEEIQTKNSKLEYQNAELERFTYTVSHDLKSPLVTISGFLGLLRMDIKNQNQAAVNKDLDQIEAAAERMSRLLEELLQLSRVGHQMGKLELTSLTGLINEATNQVSIQFEKLGVELDVDANLPEVFCDSSRLLEVYQNLIENSLKFMGDQASPRIAIGAQRKNEVDMIIIHFAPVDIVESTCTRTTEKDRFDIAWKFSSTSSSSSSASSSLSDLLITSVTVILSCRTPTITLDIKFPPSALILTACL
jgi:signal transduction histidine kinase